MPENKQIHPALTEALDTIRNFIVQTTDRQASDDEIARALKKYFVLNEIKEHIETEWTDSEMQSYGPAAGHGQGRNAC